MSSGLPILARKGVSGYGKLVLDRKTGLFFDKDAVLGNKILVLYNNVQLRRELATAARKHIVLNYSVEAMIEKYRQLYVTLINENK